MHVAPSIRGISIGNLVKTVFFFALWIWRLYEPFVDPSITANLELDRRPTFTIKIDENFYNCAIRSVGAAIG